RIEFRRVDGFREGSRKHFNGHLLGCDVVGDVFGGHGQLVVARNLLGRNQELPGIRASLRVPMQLDRSRSLEPGHQRARTLGRTLRVTAWPRWKRLPSNLTSTTGGLLAITKVFDSR